MAEIALRTYYRQIDQQIDQKQLEEALVHCKNILHHFPKDLEAYRLMGKALLERGRHGDAADVFQRVLSALPDDFLSHVGMAIVREDEGNLEAALWHMERAFEASPSNPAVQDELRRLYGRRDGIVPHRAQLTRGALARLYYKQGLYAQAETELRAGLSEQPDRPDLATLLVQVLWESGHRTEAGTLCQDLLQRLPYNLEANRVMAQIAKGQNRTEDARACRQRLEALDPYEAFASETLSAASVNAEAIRIAEIAYAPELSDNRRPDWSNALGADLSGNNPEEALPDWVRSGTALLVDDAQSLASNAGPEPDLPDWMRATTGMLNSALVGTPPGTEAPDDLALEPAEPVEAPPLTTPDDLPDWLSEATAPAGGTTTPDAGADWLNALTSPAADTPAASTPSGADELPDWLRGAAGSSENETPEWMRATPEVDSSGDADWNAMAAEDKGSPIEDVLPPLTAAALGAAGAGAIAGAPEPAHPAGASDELPAWLQNAADSNDTSTPDWLKAAANAEPAAVGHELDWLHDAPETDPSDDSVLAEDAPDWLRGATGQTGMLGGARPPEPAAATPDPAPLTDETDTMEAAADLPAWLAAARPESETSIGDPASVPDWLSAASEETGALGELPDWLKSSEPSVTNVTLPAATVEEPPIPDATIDVRTTDPTQPATGNGIDLPAWLNTAIDEASDAQVAPSSESLNDDEAFAWLESLAA
ncbi:MAG: tetratricopeptide repeat protein, partial [Anaerolineales bacterium]|nr:tetratricopeptide repeat protein [Anaerolineales bacterium]